jgi:hypothetical protein
VKKINPDLTFWKGTSMRKLLFTILCLSLLLPAAFAQTSPSAPSSSGLVVFETFGSGNAVDATQAGVLPGNMTVRTVLFAAANPSLGRNIGVAVVNPNTQVANVIMKLRRGTDGTEASEKRFTIGSHQQKSTFISELFADVPAISLDFDGTIDIASDVPVAILGLRFRETNFSTIPITATSNSTTVPQISPGVGGTYAVILPQFASGGGWSSEIVISNTTTAHMTVRVDLFKQDGTPLVTRLNGVPGSTFTQFTIPASGLLMLENDDTSSAIQVGYAIVTPGSPLVATTPTVIATSPANQATQVALTQNIAATFSEAMNPSTVNTDTFTVATQLVQEQQGTTSVSGSVSYLGNTATFSPSGPLAPNTTYLATITTGAKNVSGVAMAANYVWTFKTGSQNQGSTPVNPPVTPPVIPPVVPPAHLGPAAVALGVAGPYAILAGSGVTSSGPTIINGSLGSSPTGTLVGAPVVNGSIDLANPAAAAAKLALTTAYNDAAGRTVNSISLPGNLNGLTLAPGLYTNSSSVMLSVGGAVTLDAQGDSTAVWIFQIGSTLTTFPGSQIILSGGAKAANIFWQVGTSATLGTTSIFKGTILADQSISLGTGAVMEGRALTRIAAVTLLSNVVTVPSP